MWSDWPKRTLIFPSIGLCEHFAQLFHMEIKLDWQTFGLYKSYSQNFDISYDNRTTPVVWLLVISSVHLLKSSEVGWIFIAKRNSSFNSNLRTSMKRDRRFKNYTRIFCLRSTCGFFCGRTLICAINNRKCQHNLNVWILFNNNKVLFCVPCQCL